MTEYDYWKIFPRMPKKVTIGDITVRDGFQHEEKFISTQAKKFYLEELIFAGCRDIEVTNLGNPFLMPQFRDAEELLAHVRSDRFKQRCAGKGVNYDDITFTAITIREGAVNRAIELREKGIGPDRLLMMVSTEEEHHFANSGTTLPDYWAEAERCIKKCNDAGMKMCGTVSTIWGSPIGGATKLKDAVEFTKRFLEIGAHDIEHADHDGSASAAEVYRYYAMILDEIPDPDLHIAHFHETKRVASASVLAALQAGITHFEATLGGMGGQPANFLDVGGGANVETVRNGFEIILSDPNVKGILVNIFGGIMRCDTIAEGVIAAVKELGVDIPIVIRMEGTNVEEGRRILAESGLDLINAVTLSDAAEKVAAIATS